MLTKLFTKKSKEIFTLFIPCSKNPYFSYREKKLDSITQLFNSHSVTFEVKETISHEKGFWIIFSLEANEKSFTSLKNDPAFSDYLIYETENGQSSENELEIINEDHDEFSNVDNFKL